MSVLQTSWSVDKGASPNAGTIVVDSAAGNDRMIVAIIGVYDLNPDTHTVVLDPLGGDEVTLTPLLNVAGNNLDEAPSNARLHVGVYYVLDGAMPAGAGTYNIELQYGPLLDDGSFIEVFYIENATQGAPELVASSESIGTATPSVTIAPTAGAFTLDGVVSNDIFTAGYTAGTNQTEIFESLLNTTYGFGSKSVAEATLSWTDTSSGSNDYLQAYVSITALDVAAPLLTDPDYSTLTSFSVTPIVSTDDATGTMYQVVCLDTVSPPNSTQVVAATDGDGNAPADSANQATSGTGAQTFAATGDILLPGTNYVIYYAQVDGGALVSNSPSVAITTLGHTQKLDFKLYQTFGGEIDQVIPKPVLTNPAINQSTQTTWIASVTTDKDNGVMSMVIVPYTDVPTVDQIKQGLQSNGEAAIVSKTEPISVVGEHVFSIITGLSDGASYYAYFVHTDITNTSSLPVYEYLKTFQPTEEVEEEGNTIETVGMIVDVVRSSWNLN